METKEKNYEEFIEKYLTSDKGGYVTGNEVGFDKQKGLNVNDLFSFIKDSQPKQWKKIENAHNSNAEKYFLQQLDKKINEFGLLSVLRKGIKLNGATIKFAFFKPENNINNETIELYNKNICKLVRQLHYSYSNKNSLDSVLFINGFPIVTIELKNEFTGQTYENAIKQYKYDRNPEEIIFQFNKRSLVHFAVDLQEVYMTTKLKGLSTRFLPFNQGSNGAGNNGGKGNPNNDSGFLTSYLWEDVLNKDSLFDILNKFIQLEEKKDKKTGDTKKALIFPRYHQLDVVRKLLINTKQNGSGKNYLIQHSAGSGKSNSIAWLAYRLATIHNDNKPIFDSVIVITDRRVLDGQLQDTIYQFEHTTGLVEKIDKNKSSKHLLQAVNDGKRIIITTLQKFPIIYKDINAENKKFAIIVDEAHSSQTGDSAKKLKQGLGDLEEAIRIESDLEDNFIDDEEKLLNELASHGVQKNLSFYAFTATPKSKTLQIFGTKTESGSYIPFHIYSMQQAIEEGFILDVLQNYMTYSTFYKLVKKTQDDPELEAGRGIKELIRFETLHPTNITQKTAIIIEQFLNTTSKKIGGQAKAMVVTPSRLHAVRYVNAFKDYIKSKSLEEKCKVLVAFSGEVFDTELNETFTEESINIDNKGNRIKESQLPEAFENDYNVLIVAEKYQTGFDQPLLHSMFVDKKLSGIKAVQTLSRLNRICEGKTDTFVLDFVNKAEDIQESFQPYYQGTVLTEGFDVNNVYDIYSRLEAYKITDNADIENFAKEYYSNSDDMGKLSSFLYKAKQKYIGLDKSDKLEFKSIMQAFLRSYNFIIQVARMNDKDLQSSYIYYKYLNQFLPKEHTKNVEVSDLVELEFFKIEKKFEGCISLTKDEGEIMPPTGDIGKAKEIEKNKLSEIINKINSKYQTNFTHIDKVFEQIENDYLDDERMRLFAVNNEENAFKKVYDKEFENKAIKRYEQDKELFDIMFKDEEVMENIKSALFKAIYQKLKSIQL